MSIVLARGSLSLSCLVLIYWVVFSIFPNVQYFSFRKNNPAFLLFFFPLVFFSLCDFSVWADIMIIFILFMPFLLRYMMDCKWAMGSCFHVCLFFFFFYMLCSSILYVQYVYIFYSSFVYKSHFIYFLFIFCFITYPFRYSHLVYPSVIFIYVSLSQYLSI